MHRKNLLLNCIKGLMEFEDRFDSVDPENVDWICERLTWHKIMPLAAAVNDPQNPKCPALNRTFKDVLIKSAFQESYYLRQITDLFQILTEASIDFIPYKGPFWTQQLYPDYSWRNIGDVDLFLTRDNARTASSLLQSMGYTPVIVKGSEDEDFTIRGALTLYPPPSGEHRFPVQLHWALLPSHRFVTIGFIRGEDLTAGAEHEQWKGIPYLLPRLEVRFLYYILHATCQHQFNRFVHIMTLTHLIKKSPQMDWTTVYTMAQERGALVPLYYALKFMDAFLPLPEPALELMHRHVPSVKVRLGAMGLTPHATLLATKQRRKLGRQIFRLAMSW